jgi:hypothetical protein
MNPLSFAVFPSVEGIIKRKLEAAGVLPKRKKVYRV